MTETRSTCYYGYSNKTKTKSCAYDSVTTDPHRQINTFRVQEGVEGERTNTEGLSLITLD